MSKSPIVKSKNINTQDNVVRNSWSDINYTASYLFVYWWNLVL